MGEPPEPRLPRFLGDDREWRRAPGRPAVRQSLKNDPENSYFGWSIGRTLAQLGKYAEAVAILEAAQKKPGGDWTAILSELAYVRAREGRVADALNLIAQLRARAKTEFVDPYLLAMAYSGLGDTAETLHQLDLAVKGHSTWIPSLPVDPKFVFLRTDPRFQQLLVALKLPAKHQK